MPVKLFTEEEKQLIKEVLKTPKTADQIRKELNLKKNESSFKTFINKCENSCLPVWEDNHLFGLLQR